MLTVTNVTKHYDKFSLDNVSFSLPKGYIMGFLGANGAGKTTTIKAILDLIPLDGGEIDIMGYDSVKDNIAIKQNVGVSLGEFKNYSGKTARQIANIFKSFCNNWQEEQYRMLLERFSIDDTKRIKELSTGMRGKLSIALSLAHGAKLLILDEPTSGLDPIAREELLNLFKEVVSDGERSIIFSTHITSDLDKCADLIVFINNGKIVLRTDKDTLIDNHLIIAGGLEQLTPDIKECVLGVKRNAFGFEALILRKDYNAQWQLNKAKPNLEDIMIYYYNHNKEIIQ